MVNCRCLARGIWYQVSATMCQISQVILGVQDPYGTVDYSFRLRLMQFLYRPWIHSSMSNAALSTKSELWPPAIAGPLKYNQTTSWLCSMSYHRDIIISNYAGQVNLTLSTIWCVNFVCACSCVVKWTTPQVAKPHNNTQGDQARVTN